MKNFSLFLLPLVLMICITSQAAATNESQAAALFLLIEPGAKQAGMGEAYTAISDDASAGYYNPAGLAFQGKDEKNLTFMHTNWLPKLASDMYYEYLGYAQHAEGWGNFAFNLVYFNMGEQSITNSTSSEILGKFTSFELMASGSYGATMTDNLSLGLTLKAIYSKLADSGQEAEQGKGIGSSFALDFGAMYKTPVQGLTLGAAIHNIGPKISYIDVSQADPLPLNFVLGLAYTPVESEFNRLRLCMDIYKPLVSRDTTPLGALLKAWGDEGASEEIRQIDYKIGTEYVYNNFMALRAGYTYDKDGEIKSPTFGVGIIYEKLNVDIAYYAARDNPMQDSMRFSFAYNF
jgi:long-subunit fatty acid transport protein